ncbi:hypothetical protein BB558_001130 [Smittium angustum]|uniref:Piwi domain-containing protein n=1 Tax=Smittium angustum TaxID=133377 RepID=A0A2U1JCA2_SMIAN|nr:hypothetical protein BB558_001130 [Smittium angustum]
MEGVPAESKPLEVHLAKRTGFGTLGRPVNIQTNYYEVTSVLDTTIYQYSIDITQKPYVLKEGEVPRPPRERKFPPKFLREIFGSFIAQYGSSKLGGTQIAYDGSKAAYAPTRLFLDSKTQEFETSHVEGGRARSFIVKIQEAAQIDLSDLKRFIKGEEVDPSVWSSGLRVLDTALYQDISLTHTKVGRSFFTQADSISLGEGVELWRGIFQSIKAGQGKLYLNLDIANTAFLMHGNVIDFVVSVLQVRDPRDLERMDSPERWVKIKRLIKGTLMSIRHTKRGEVRLKAKGLSDLSAEKIIFEMTDPETNATKKISVSDYFNDRYKIRLKYPYLPCIEFPKSNFIPMELCKLEPGHHYKRKLNEQQTSTMIKFACQKPKARQEMIQRNFNDMNCNNNPVMKAFNFSVSNRMVTLKARQLPTPEVFYSDASRERSLKPNGGAWNMRDKVVWKGTTLNVWGVVVFVDQRKASQSSIQNFLRTLVSTCKNTGLDIVNSRPSISYVNPMSNLSQQLESAFRKVGDEAQAYPQMLLCVLPTASSSLYSKIKSVAYTELGVHTQCMLHKHTMRPNPQYCANLCLKMNVKLGGISNALKSASLPKVSSVPTIIFGADVTHPGIGETDRPSIAAVVGSMDQQFCRYKAMLAQQPARVEIIQNLAGIVREQLVSFYQANNAKPARIVFYRDGVSEGQFAEVMATEVQAIHDACEGLEKGYNPKITFIIVKKGHRARFFPLDQRESDRSGNCMPGTVVDTDITSPFLYDFYLLSHSGIQGTSKCVHYVVLKDENEFSPDEIQTLSYNMCYLYAICTRSVSIVPCVYYAHRVAFRARSHTKDVWGSSDTGSIASGYQGESVQQEFAGRLLPVHDRLKQTMYFM